MFKHDKVDEKWTNNPLLNGYLEAVIWTEEETLSDLDTGDDLIVPEHFSPESIKKATEECEAFENANRRDIEEGLGYGKAGHDFWLTRNHHGAGFWDGDWEESAGERLTLSAQMFGEVYLYVGDDNKIHFSNE